MSLDTTLDLKLSVIILAVSVVERMKLCIQSKVYYVIIFELKNIII